MNGLTYYKKKRLRREEARFKLTKRDNRRFNKLRYNKDIIEHFDTVEVYKIEKLCSVDPASALEKLEAYLDMHPSDYYAHTLHSSFLIVLRRYDEALEVLTLAEKILNRDKSFKKFDEKYSARVNCLAYAKLKYHLYCGNYEIAHDIIMNNVDLNGSSLTYKTVFYIKNKLNTCDKMNYFEQSYSMMQILDYNEERMFEHIVKHLTEGNDGKLYPNANVFVRDFPIRRVIEEAKKYLVDENAIYLGLVEDDYYFRYDDCGKENNRFVNYFKIVCFHGTKNIITVLPVAKSNTFSCVDLNYMNLSNMDKCKQLVLSQKKDVV